MEEMSLEKVLEVTRNELAQLKVPAGLIEELGLPLMRAIGNLNACLKAISSAKKEKVPDDAPVVDLEIDPNE